MTWISACELGHPPRRKRMISRAHLGNRIQSRSFHACTKMMVSQSTPPTHPCSFLSSPCPHTRRESLPPCSTIMVALEALSTLVVTAKALYDASQTAKENCEECAAIYRTVVSLDDVIRKSANDYISESTMLRLNKITRYAPYSKKQTSSDLKSRMLRGIADMIGSLQKRPWLYRLLHSTRVKGKLRLARQELFDATQEFQVRNLSLFLALCRGCFLDWHEHRDPQHLSRSPPMSTDPPRSQPEGRGRRAKRLFSGAIVFGRRHDRGKRYPIHTRDAR